MYVLCPRACIFIITEYKKQRFQRAFSFHDEALKSHDKKLYRTVLP